MSNATQKDIPFRPVNFPPVDIEVSHRDDKSIVLKSRLDLTLREHHLPAYLRRHAAARPDRVWFAQRRPKGGDWTKITFSEGLNIVNRLTQGLISLGLEPGSRVAILSANSLEHAMMTIAIMQARLIVAPVSVAYSLQSKGHEKLKEVVDTIKPSAFFVQNGKQFEAALASVNTENAIEIAVDDLLPNQVNYQALLDSTVTDQVEASVNAIDVDDTARIMFTSGSTGSPKGVPGTHKAITIVAESNLKTTGVIEEGQAIRLDWLPWNHVFGATGVALCIVSGGSFYIDDGRPMGALFQETLDNLAEVQPTGFSTVPAAYAMLVDRLEQNDEFAKIFFTNIHNCGYGGASLPADIVERLQALSIKHIGMRTSITSAYGATETGPGGAFIYWPTDRTGLVGLPHPGYELKLLPIDDSRFELRVKGESVTKGYFGRPDLNKDIFDEEGFYKIGDTVRLADPNNILEGLAFAGRLSEEFKLTSGTFVLAGSLRMRLLDAVGPIFSDVVICGENQAFVGVMAWLNVDVAQKIAERPNASREELNVDPAITDHLKEKIAIYNANNPGQSNRIKRFLLLDEAPSIDKNEVTDKGSINQRGVQQNRPELVASLFTTELNNHVIDLSAS